MNKEINLTIGRHYKPTIINLIDITFPLSIYDRSPQPYRILNGWEEGNEDKETTLRDVAIIIWELCGQGVMKNLSFEIAKHLDLDKTDVHMAVVRVMNEYQSLPAADAEKKLDDIWNMHLDSLKKE